ncbi:Cro/CI family transcriptional regulator [Shewanella algae]|jgi:DNA-binding transcriptional regulator YdaS (Cro superfamily)|uniref:Cro/CI family transcriptional regulator n=1 Tax=Shewanella algae TaxID=38313 RepID=UPI001AB01137|nr:Cro/CI family transcriptional regulator [Shewanella algae]MBO2582512.1 Cro/Cl family transcriptional regulator [Shewanella algae]
MKTSDAISHFGSKTNLANALGVTHSAVCQWGEEVPPRRAYQLERITKGKLKYVEGRVKS